MAKIQPRKVNCYGIRIRRAAATITKYYDKSLAPVNLTTSQFSLLNDIKHIKSCNKTELAQYAKLDRTTIVRNLNILIEKGLVEEVPAQTNRNNLVQLTQLGEKAAEQGYILWKQTQEEIKEVIGRENLNQFKEILEKIEDLV